MNKNTIITGQKRHAAHRVNSSSSCCEEVSEGSKGAFLPTSHRFCGFACACLEEAWGLAKTRNRDSTLIAHKRLPEHSSDEEGWLSALNL